MRYKAIIGRIIEEKDYKKYGFRKYSNCDYLNLQEKEYLEERKKERYKYNKYVIGGLFLLTLLLGLALINFPNLANLFGWSLGIFIISGIIIELWNIPKRKGYWYFDAPVPIEKPHNYKLNDEVEINIKISRKG